jgi:hypothetical protein
MFSNYILLNEAFCLAHTGHTSADGLLRFAYAVTLLGYYVAAENTLDEFPELFINDTYLSGIPIIELITSDFPPPSQPF